MQDNSSHSHKIAYWPEKRLYYCQHCDGEWTKAEYEAEERS